MPNSGHTNQDSRAATSNEEDSPRSRQILSTEISFPVLNEIDDEGEAKDIEGLALLREIFPDESTEELKKMHEDRLRKSAFASTADSLLPESPTSPLPSRLVTGIWRELLDSSSTWKRQKKKPLHWEENILPENFLRLPPDFAVRRRNEQRRCWEYHLVEEMKNKCNAQCMRILNENWISYQKYTRVIFRHPYVGLGITIKEHRGLVQIHALVSNDGNHFRNMFIPKEIDGPSMHIGIDPGDILLGVNGCAFLESGSNKERVVHDAVSIINSSPDPVVLHFAKPKAVETTLPSLQNFTPSLLDTIEHEEETLTMYNSMEPTQLHFGVRLSIHPFALALASRDLIRNENEQELITSKIMQFTERARQWELNSSFLVDSRTFALRHQRFAHVVVNSLGTASFPFDQRNQNEFKTFSPSTPIVRASHSYVHNALNGFNETLKQDISSYRQLNESESRSEKCRFTYLGFRHINDRLIVQNDADFVIPLIGVMKALSVRILNTFIDGDRTAYTIWIYDVESGKEWYAPIRYFCDFQDLRSATQHLCPTVCNFAFPTQGWNVFGNREVSESDEVRASKCQQLERFLRSLCAMIYTENLHPTIAEVAIHVQSFLGCEDVRSEVDTGVGSRTPTIAGVNHNAEQLNVRMLLKRSLQMYTYRLFLLEIMKGIVNHFVETVRSRGPKLSEIETLESQGRIYLKERAMNELKQIQAFLDKVQKLVIDGCIDDFRLIAMHQQFASIRSYIDGENGDSYWDHLVREAVREQVEVEVYVPLRSIISRLLVNGWRHEDMEVHFKIQELRKRPQSFFRIPDEKLSRSNWQSVSSILKQGASLSTLPCAKLRAIVDAASELTRLYSNEHAAPLNDNDDSCHIYNKKETTGRNLLGADDFLPIFIFCVVRADMERPCALCVLLRSLCDPINRIGEVGYYLASFEAAITHIQEVDLTEDREEMLSFLSVPLSEET